MKRKPKGYWKDFENIKRELEEVIKKLGRFPLGRELEKMGKKSLLYWIGRCHGGLCEVCKKMGWKTKKELREEYWRDFENVKKELEEMIKKLGRFPMYKEIERTRYTILYWVEKYHGGLARVREKMGYETSKRKPPRYWKDINNVKKELEEVIEKLGRIPTYKELVKMGKSSLCSQVSRYHGKLHKIYEEMGYEAKKTFSEYWKNFENVKKELEEVIEKLGRFPLRKELIEMKKNTLVYWIVKYHGGLTEVRKKMGYKLKRKPSEYWRDFENIKRELEEVIKKLGKFPSRKELVEMRKSSVSYWSVKYHGGLAEVRKKMGYE
jgi:exonuclease VII small subunit